MTPATLASWFAGFFVSVARSDQEAAAISSSVDCQPRRASLAHWNFRVTRFFAPRFVELQSALALDPRLVVCTHQQHDRYDDRAHVVVYPLFGEDLFTVHEGHDYEAGVENVEKEPHGDRDLGSAESIQGFDDQLGSRLDLARLSCVEQRAQRASIGEVGGIKATDRKVEIRVDQPEAVKSTILLGEVRLTTL